MAKLFPIYHIHSKAPVKKEVGLKHVIMGFDASLTVFDYLLINVGPLMADFLTVLGFIELTYI